MKHIQLMVLVFCLSFLGMAVPASAQGLSSVIFLAEHLPPYTYDAGGEPSGVGYEILEAALQAVGIEKDLSKIPVYPWARVYNTVLHTPKTSAFVMARTEQREDLFKWAGPILNFRLVSVSRKGKVSIKDKTDFGQYSVGLVRGGSAYDLLQAEGYSVAKAEMSPTVKDAVFKMAYGRIDLVTGDEQIILYELMRAGLNPSDFEVSLILNEQVSYIAFNRETPDEVVETMQRGVDTIRANGELKQILDKYLLQ